MERAKQHPTERSKRRQEILPGAADAWALRGEHAGGAPHKFGLELNGQKLLALDMNDCKFATTYRQGEEEDERERAKEKF